jgi:small subunit ribosomal protein S6
MRINEDVLRYLTIRVDELEEGPSPIMLNRGGREDRPRRGDRDRYDDRGDRGDRVPYERAPAEATPAVEV